VNSYILFGLLFLVACTPTNGTLCFKTENAGWSDFFYSNRTDHKVNEDMKLLITICEKSASNDSKIVPFPVKEIKQSNVNLRLGLENLFLEIKRIPKIFLLKDGINCLSPTAV